MAAHENPQHPAPQPKNHLPISEWIAAGVGLTLVVGVLGFLIYQAVMEPSPVPDVTVRVESILPLRGGYLVKIIITNHGGATAEGLIVEGELRQGGEQKELSHTEIDYAPAHAEKRGGLFFSQDPRQGELQVRALGYEEP